MSSSLDDIFAGKSEQEPVAVTTPEPVQSESSVPESGPEIGDESPPSGVNRDPLTGKFAPKASPDSGQPANTEAPPDPEADPKNWTYAAYKDEKQKRVEAQRRADDLQRQLQSMSPQQPEKQFWDDPEGNLASRDQRLEQRIFQSTMRASKAENIAVHGKAVVDEMESAIGAAMQSGDSSVYLLRDQMLQSDDPVSVAMAWFNQRPERVYQRAAEDPETEKRVFAKYGMVPPTSPTAQQPQQQPGPARVAPVMPTPLEASRNVGNRNGLPWAGPQPLEDIFQRRRAQTR